MPLLSDRNSIVFDGVGQYVPGHVKVNSFHFVTTSNSGVVEVLNKPAGRQIYQSAPLNANSEAYSGPIGWVDGLFVAQLPAGGRLEVFYE